MMNQCANLLGYTHIVALFVEMDYIKNGKTKQAIINLVGCYARTSHIARIYGCLCSAEKLRPLG